MQYEDNASRTLCHRAYPNGIIENKLHLSSYVDVFLQIVDRYSNYAWISAKWLFKRSFLIRVTIRAWFLESGCLGVNFAIKDN